MTSIAALEKKVESHASVRSGRLDDRRISAAAGL
jgi:hypothetical protein